MTSKEFGESESLGIRRSGSNGLGMTLLWARLSVVMVVAVAVVVVMVMVMIMIMVVTMTLLGLLRSPHPHLSLSLLLDMLDELWHSHASLFSIDAQL